MIFDYINDDGGKVAREYPIGEAPSEFWENGTRFYRDYSTLQWRSVVKDKEVVSIQAPLKGSRWDDPKNPAPAYTPDLQPVFSNRRQMKEWAKRSENEHGTYAVDD